MLGSRYQVVVVGSGYGGSIAAYRFARAGFKVALLERGREIPTGEFPETLARASREFQVDTPIKKAGNSQGLFDLRVNHDISVLVGCGLGGTSLINAGVTIEPDPRVFDDASWPAEIREDREGLRRAFAAAKEMLAPELYPDDRPDPAKLRSLRRGAEAIGASCEKVPINVSFTSGPNHVGVDERPCTDCGNCVSGCNDGAKRTLPMTYLPAAVAAGAEVFCGLNVGWVGNGPRGWIVHADALGGDRHRFDAPSLTIGADLVVLAAGALGSTEILLRSREGGLTLSDRLGEGFSGNGDTLGFAAFTDELVDGVGNTRRERKNQVDRRVGPCIIGIVDLRETDDLEDGMIIEDGAIPGVMGSRLGPMMRAAAPGDGTTSDATRRLQTHLVMAQDDAGGHMELEDDRLRVRWPAVGDQPTFARIDATLRDLAEAQDGNYMGNPVWSRLLRNSLVTVHPLGGCSMGDAGQHGVVNHRGEVFAGPEQDVHPGLVVLDGSIIPRSLGVNPLLTISGLAERACASLLASPPVDWTAPLAPIQPGADRPGVSFTETMKGHVFIGPTPSPVVAARLARNVGAEFSVTVTVSIDDLVGRILDDEISGTLSGTASAGSLSGRAMTLSEGTFTLFAPDPAAADTRLMQYQAFCTADDGRRFRLQGHREFEPGTPLDWWAGTTTLYLTLTDDRSKERVGSGVLRTAAVDVARQISTVRAIHASSRLDAVRQPAAFMGAYLKTMIRIYTNVRRPPRETTGPAPRPAYATDVPARSFVVATPDRSEIRLTNHAGDGARVLLIPDLGCTSGTYATRDVHLVNHLRDRGHDVWTLDWRGSPGVGRVAPKSTIGTAVAEDIPVALAAIGDGSPLHVIGHGLGAGIVLGALHEGLGPVASVVSLQMGLEVIPTLIERLRLQVTAEELAIRKGLSQPVRNRWTRPGDRRERVAPGLSRLGAPGRSQRCRRAGCRQLQALYGDIVSHDQLNPEAHDLLETIVGPVEPELLRSAYAIRRRGTLLLDQTVSAPGLAVPMTFVHSEANGVYQPHGTRRSVDALRSANPGVRYDWAPLDHLGHLDVLLSPRAGRELLPIIDSHLARVASTA
jgi:cholesterol oxidase